MDKRTEFLLDPIINIFSFKRPCGLTQYAYDIAVIIAMVFLFGTAGAIFYPLCVLWFLAFPVLSFAAFTASCRRLYDSGYGMKYMALLLIPVIGWFLLIGPLLHPTDNGLRDYDRRKKEKYEKEYY